MEGDAPGVLVRRPKPWAVAVAGTATALGVLAFTADAVDGKTGQIMVAMVSSGLAWGLAALLAGRAAVGRRRAVTGATVLLVAATLVYYLLILLVGRRSSGGGLPDGLRSVAAMTTAWLVVSVVAGPVFGLLGQMTRTMPSAGAALAAGVACGLLSGQGWQEITATPPWHVVAAAGRPDTGFFHGASVAQLVEILFPLAVLAWLATARRLWRAWPVLFLALIVATTLSALFWRLLTAVSYQLA